MNAGVSRSLRHCGRTLLLAALLAVAPSCQPVPDSSAGAVTVTAESCAPPAAAMSAPVSHVIAGDSAPCQVEFRKTNVRLSSDVAGTIPDPGSYIARRSDGKFITSTLSGGGAALWSATGEFEREIGRAGHGPGELIGTTIVYTDAMDRLYVRDNSMRWSVFSPTFQFIRSMSAAASGGLRGYTQILDDGSVLVSSPVGAEADSSYFRIFSSEGTLVRSFGGRPRVRGPGEGRRIAYMSGDTFWAGPDEATDSGYVLQQWNIDGRLLRTIRRDTPWYPRVQPPTSPEHPPGPSLRALHVDSAGYLTTVIRVDDERWRWIPDRTLRRESEVELFDLIVEVIDPASGRLVASRRFDDGRSSIPAPLISRTRLGALPVDSATDVSAIAIYEMMLGRKP